MRISQEENKKLFERLRECEKDSPEYIKLVNRIFEYNHRLIFAGANRYAMIRRHDFDDICAVAEIGLYKAIPKYNLEKDVNFSTYAITAIRRKIKRYLEIELRQIKTTSFDKQIGDENDEGRACTLIDVTAGDEDVEKEVILREQKEFLKDHIYCLDKSQIQVLKMRYFDCLEGEEVGRRLGFSRQYVKMCEDKAVAKFKYILEHIPPEGLLSREEKLKLRGELKSIIETKLSKSQKDVLLALYYAPEAKSYRALSEQLGIEEHRFYCERTNGKKRLIEEYNDIHKNRPLSEISIVTTLEYNEEK